MTQYQSRHALPSPVAACFMAWWARLQAEDADGAARADRANLRRAHDLCAVTCTPAFQRLYRDLVAANQGQRWPEWQEERWAAVVGLAAHVKECSELNLPQAMSQREEGSDRNRVSDLRFTRLLDAPDMEALFAGLRRLMPLISHRTHPEALAQDLLGWGDRVKKNWAYAYRWTRKA